MTRSSRRPVLAACGEPGASVAAVAQAHGVNANLVRQWQVGRGMKRCGVEQGSAGDTPVGVSAAAALGASPIVPFVPVQLPPPAAATQPDQPGRADEGIQVELTRSGAKLVVRWPAAQASACACWLGELAAVLAR